MDLLVLIKHLTVVTFETIQIGKPDIMMLGAFAILMVLLTYLSIRNFFLRQSLIHHKQRYLQLEHESDRLKSEISKQTIHLELAVQKSEEANRLKSLFLANMSHEIRTPLNGIMGFSELIIADDLDQYSRKIYADQITHNSQNLLKLIDQIFHLSIIEAGKVSVQKEHFKLQDLLNIVQREISLKIAAMDKPIRLLINLENDDYVIHTDKEKLKHIFDNLIDNALKFTTKGYIEISCIRMEREFLFHICDSGCGIAEDEYELIFDPFIQGADTLKKIKGGSGLGLSNVKNYVILLGGKVWCERNKPNGAIFSFTIPAPYIKEKDLLKMLRYSMFNN
ncbi:MAG: HAMP domain-containing histidine kinase [Prolixibacteraceae bacterium]|nr:HAMP domain-containing histidine kinase [Prolixibacteraceae bacterium]